ncbi:hypothetical protein Pcinc_018311 [Petrolisthes cinctipes]|uniref:CUB domain-containing protein n=1 Tax=Petrolisthes cinctipes TaxID=88211 RepID=A0AAE1KMW2_PETCI|nr:hypothetical protein Pcinc_018311 [Petrolisthes cinctipes]
MNHLLSTNTTCSLPTPPTPPAIHQHHLLVTYTICSLPTPLALPPTPTALHLIYLLVTWPAPTGCLQYYTETSGTITSFNHNNAGPTTNPGTRQIANTNYGVCVEMADGYCGIIWERNTTGGDYGFSMTGNPAGLPPGILGTPDVSETGTTDCTTDYVIIPGGVTDLGVQEDRYCGLGFPNSVTSTNKPFMLYVTTDEAELVAPPDISDINNSGFSLNYRQITNC